MTKSRESTESIAARVEEAITSVEPEATDRDKAAACIALAVFYAQESDVPYTREEFVRDMGNAWDYGVQLDTVAALDANVGGVRSS